jgi:hypothetical protein
MKTAILTAVLALELSAAGVLVTPKGKTYHAAKSCISLMRSRTVQTIEEKDAKTRKLKPCGICYRSKKEKIQ